jgi:hypothetical protein
LREVLIESIQTRLPKSAVAFDPFRGRLHGCGIDAQTVDTAVARARE